MKKNSNNTIISQAHVHVLHVYTFLLIDNIKISQLVYKKFQFTGILSYLGAWFLIVNKCTSFKCYIIIYF